MKEPFSFKENKGFSRVLPFLFALLILFGLGSCASMTKSKVLSTEYEPTEDSGYLYGQFHLLADEIEVWKKVLSLKFTSLPTMVIVVQNLDTAKKYGFVLEEKEEERLQIIAVPPGNYQFDKIEYVSRSIAVETDDFDMEGYENTFVVEPNTAVYIGNFSGESQEETVRVSRTASAIDTSWKLNLSKSNYNENTIIIQEKYPFLAEASILFASTMNENLIGDSTDFTPGSYIVAVFFRAIENNQPEAVKALIEQGVDVNIQDSDGWTALMHAATDGQTEMVKELLAVSADVSMKNNDGNTALMVTGNHPDIIDLLITSPKTNNSNQTQQTSPKINNSNQNQQTTHEYVLEKAHQQPVE